MTDAISLKYRDILQIYGTSITDDNQKALLGMLNAKGFTDTNLYFLLIQQNKPHHNLSEQCLFQIHPSPSLESSNHSLLENKQSKSNISDINRFNQRSQLMKGNQVRFGQEIVLKHVYSGYYLKSSTQCGQSELGAFKSKLTLNLDQTISFRIDPFRSFQKHGWIIYLDQPILLINVEFKSYLSIGSPQTNIFLDMTIDQPPNSDLEELQKDSQILRHRPKIKCPQSFNKRLQIIQLLKPNLCYKFLKPSIIPSGKSQIQVYDMVYFQHTNKNSVLSTDIHAESVLLKEKKNKKDTQTQSTVWQILVDKQLNNQFIVRHFISGRALYFNKTGSIYLDTFQFNENDENFLILKNLNKKEKVFINEGQCVQLQGGDKIVIQGKVIQKEYQHPLQKVYNIYKYYNTQIDRYKIQEHSFKVYRIPSKHKYDLKFISSSFELLQQYSKLLRTVSYLDTYYMHTDSEDPNEYIEQLGNILRYDVIIKQVVQCLMRIKGFVFSQELQQEMNENKDFIDVRRIELMRNIGLIQIFIQIVYYYGQMIEIIQELFRDSGMTYEKQIIIHPFQLIYQILKLMTIDQKTKIYISRWIKLFISQLMKYNYIFIYNFLLDLFEENKISISSEISQQDIQNLMSILLNGKLIDQTILQKRILIICKICKSGSSSIKRNQDIVRQFLLQKQGNSLKFWFSSTDVQLDNKKENIYNKGIVYVHRYYEQQKFELKYFLQNFNTNYFIAFLNFCANITIHHNLQSKKVVEKLIPISALCCILANPEYYDLIFLKQFEAFINIIHYVYIDVKGFETIRRIAKVREWQKIKQKTVILKSHSTMKKALQNQINYLIFWIKQVMKQTQNMNETTLIRLIQLTKTTITLGLWEDVQQFRQLFASILQKIIKHNYNLQLEQQYDSIFSVTQKTSNQYHLLMRAKAIALQIIDIMIDMENNTRISILTCFIKEIINEQIQVQHYDKRKYSIRDDENGGWISQIFKPYKNINILQKYQNEKMQIFNPDFYINKILELTPDQQQQNLPLNRRRYFFSQISHRDHALYVFMKLAKETKNNQRVINYSLNLISRIFRQRSDLIEGFNHVIIVAKGQFFKLFKHSREIVRPKIKFLTLPNIKQRNKEQDEKDDIAIWRPYQQNSKQKCGVIQQIAFLCQILKTGRKVQMLQNRNSLAYQDLAPENALFSIYNQRQYPNQLYQTLIKNQDMHLVFIEYMKLLGKQIDNKLHKSCLHAIYSYLTMLAWNHQKNKQDLMQIFGEGINHLKFNIGALQFIRELAINNSLFLKNDGMVETFLDTVLDIINNIGIDNFYKSKLIFSLRSLIILYQSTLPKTQVAILSRMQNRSFKNIIVYLIDDNTFNTSLFSMDQFKSWIQQYLQRKRFDLKRCNLGTQLTYIEAFFSLFRCLIECDNRVNKNKMSNMHPLQFVLNLLQQCKDCIPLRKTLRGYINQLYYLYMEYDIHIFQTILQHQIENINHDFQLILDFIDNYQAIFQIELINYTRYKFMASHYLGLLYQNLILLQSLFSNQKFIDWARNFINQTKYFELLMSIMQKVGYVYNSYLQKKKKKNRSIINLMNQVKWNFLEIVPILHWNSISKKYSLETVTLVKNQYNSQKSLSKGDFRYNIKKGFWKNFLQFSKVSNRYKHFKHLRLSETNIERSQKLEYILFNKTCFIPHKNQQFLNHYSPFYQKKFDPDPNDLENQNLSQVHTALVNIMTQKKMFKIMIKQEMEGIGQFFCRLTSGEYKQDENPQKFCKQFIINVVQMICKNPERVQKNLIEIFVRMLHLYVESKVDKGRLIGISVDQWEPDTCTQMQKKDLEKMQNELIEGGCGKLVAKLLAIERQDLQLVDQILLFAISLLVYGNSNAQEDIYKELLVDPQNLMIRTLNKYLEKLETEIFEQKTHREHPAKKPTKKKKLFNISYIDNFDHYVCQERTMQKVLYSMDALEKQKMIRQQKVNVISRIYRFVQLLCQNNNKQMKNFLRTQVQKNNQEHPFSINFVQNACRRLSKKITKLSSDQVKMATAPIEFMLQISQIPCVENQLIFCQSQVFQSLCYYQSIYSGSNQDKPMDMYLLFNRVITIVISNMQGKLNQIFALILNKLSTGFLVKLIVEALKYLLVDFKETYKGKDLNKVLQWNSIDTKKQLQKIISYEQILLQNQQSCKKTYNKHLINILNIMIVVKKANQWGIETKNSIGQEYYNKFYRELSLYIHQPAMIQYLENLFIAIDIQINDSNQTVYFAKQPIFQYLSQQTKNRITWLVNRQTHRDKINGLFQFSDQAHKQMQWFYEIHFRGVRGLPINLNTCRLVKQVTIISSLLINIYTLIFYHVTFDQNLDMHIHYEYWMQRLGETTLEIIQFISCVLYLMMWWNIHYQLVRRKYKQSQENKQQAKGIINRVMNSGQKISILAYSKPQFFSILIFFIGTLLGVFFQNKYYTLHLFELIVIFINQFRISSLIFEAIWQNRGQLFAVALLWIAFIQVFITMAINFEVYVHEIEPEANCKTLYACITQIYISVRMHDKGTITSDMQYFIHLRFLLDMIFIIFTDLLFSNIFGGIIIDTFSELRDQRQQIQNDLENICFICGISRAELQKKRGNFSVHIQEKHNLWNYIFYYYYLKIKDETQYTGLQYQIRNKLQSKDISWVPEYNEDQNDKSQQFNRERMIGKLQECVLKLQQIRDDEKQFEKLDMQQEIESYSQFQQSD